MLHKLLRYTVACSHLDTIQYILDLRSEHRNDGWPTAVLPSDRMREDARAASRATVRAGEHVTPQPCRFDKSTSALEKTDCAIWAGTAGKWTHPLSREAAMSGDFWQKVDAHSRARHGSENTMAVYLRREKVGKIATNLSNFGTLRVCPTLERLGI